MQHARKDVRRENPNCIKAACFYTYTCFVYSKHTHTHTHSFWKILLTCFSGAIYVGVYMRRRVVWVEGGFVYTRVVYIHRIIQCCGCIQCVLKLCIWHFIYTIYTYILRHIYKCLRKANLVAALVPASVLTQKNAAAAAATNFTLLSILCTQ